MIPKKIFQTWETSDIPDNLRTCITNIKNTHPDFEHYLYDNQMREDFIKSNFNKSVYDAYKLLIPGAYRADLWRLCVLYIHGGFYLDIKLSCVGDFDFNQLLDTKHFCKDIKSSGGGIYNAFMVAEPSNPDIKKGIDKIVQNCANRYYGNSCLEPTGPLMLKDIITTNIDMELIYPEQTNSFENRILYIKYQNKDIIKIDYGIRNLIANTISIPSFGYLYSIKKIYLEPDTDQYQQNQSNQPIQTKQIIKNPIILRAIANRR